LKQRDDGATLGIAADGAPNDKVVAEDKHTAGATEAPSPVIENLVPQQRFLTWRFDGVGGNLGNHGKALAPDAA